MSKKLQIEYNPDFRRHFGAIWDYIADDSINRANVRDLIFKGYTIPYLVDKEKDLIIVLDIFKWMDR